MGNGSEDGAYAKAVGRRKERLFETGVFLFLIVPSMALSFFSPGMRGAGFVVTAASIILRDLALTSLVLFFLWRNREPAADIGWRKEGVLREALVGAALYVPFFLLVRIVEQALTSLGLEPSPVRLPSLVPGGGPFEVFLALLLVVTVAVSEETVFRGYLILRFRGIAGGPAPAVLLSTAVFSLGHGYAGALGLASVATMGLLLSLLYLWRKSLVAPAVIHFVQNLLGIIVLPLLAGRGG